MYVVDMQPEDRYSMMKERHAFFSSLAKDYTSLESFVKDKDRWFGVLGIELLWQTKNCLSLYIQLDYDEYEKYFILLGRDGKLVVSHVIEWQDLSCANDILNIFTRKSVKEDEIYTSY